MQINDVYTVDTVSINWTENTNWIHTSPLLYVFGITTPANWGLQFKYGTNIADSPFLQRVQQKKLGGALAVRMDTSQGENSQSKQFLVSCVFVNKSKPF